MATTKRLRGVAGMSMGVLALLMGAGTASAATGPELGLTNAIAAIDEVLQKVSPADIAFAKIEDTRQRLVDLLEGFSGR